MAFVQEEESSLLSEVGGGMVSGAVDFKGRSVVRSKSGGWLSAWFIVGVEVAERFAYYGISSNLISYLTGPLGQSKAMAAENVNIWSGAAWILPLLGASVADSFLGRYRTVVVASIIYILGLGLLTFSTMLPSISSSDCETAVNKLSCSGPQYQVIFFFFSLYLVAIGQGGYKPCVLAFGADQFDQHDSQESTAKSSFFNWSYVGLCLGTSLAYLFLNYIQDNLTWTLGFGIPCISMVTGLCLFLTGTITYRFPVEDRKMNPFLRIGKVFFKAARNQRNDSLLTGEEVSQGVLPQWNSPQFKFLDKALLEPVDSTEEKEINRRDVEDAKAVLRLIPIWATCLTYAIVVAQCSTFFTEQAVTMERTIWSGLIVPAASLQLFRVLATMFFIPIYDLILVPLASALTGKPSGITMLQRIGTGIFLSITSMVLSALVEMRRLDIAREYGLVDHDRATIPMSFWWLVPQYVLLGIADVFTLIGMQEFFYDQVSNDLKSVGLSIFLSVVGIGSFLSSILIFVIEKATGAEGHNSWFSDDLNHAHLDYFYWLLAAISTFGLLGYLHFTRYYIYRSAS